MPTRDAYYDLLNQIAALRAQLAELQASEAPEDPTEAERVAQEISELQTELTDFLGAGEEAPDGGLAQLIGLGPEAANEIGDTQVVIGVQSYDETVTSERLLGIADLYYLYQHERIGVFRAILKLQELFRSGRVRLSSGTGAVALYQYDRRRVLQYTRKERLRAYRRVFGYTDATPPAGSKPNRRFHRLFSGFNTHVARFFRDKRISEVMRPDSRDLTFGSVAVVRRAGLDLRSNLKGASYGHVNVLAVEVSQLLDLAFQILGAEDVMRLFGADSAWDAFEEILRRYLGGGNRASQRSRMAFTGREIIRWLAQPHILTSGRVEFENLLLAVGEYSEEWLTSAESLGTAATGRSRLPSNVVPMRRRVSA